MAAAITPAQNRASVLGFIPLPLHPARAAGSARGRVGESQRTARGRVRDRLGRGSRPFPKQLVDVKGAEADNGGIDQHVAGEREQDVPGGQRRRHRITRAQEAVDDPGLAADLGGVPAAEDRDEPGWERQERPPEEPARRLQPPAPAQKIPKPRYAEYDQPHADHDAEAEERDQHRGAVLGREGVQPDLAGGPVARGDETAESGYFE